MAPGHYLNTLRPRQNGRDFADDTFKRIFLNENIRISIKISPKFVTKGLINNIPSLVQIMGYLTDAYLRHSASVGWSIWPSSPPRMRHSAAAGWRVDT